MFGTRGTEGDGMSTVTISGELGVTRLLDDGDRQRQLELFAAVFASIAESPSKHGERGR